VDEKTDHPVCEKDWHKQKRELGINGFSGRFTAREATILASRKRKPQEEMQKNDNGNKGARKMVG